MADPLDALDGTDEVFVMDLESVLDHQPVNRQPAPDRLEHRIVAGGTHDESRSTRKGPVMRARAGDTLVVSGSHTRTGLIVRVVGPDGAPPYVVKWLVDGHIAMVTPDQYSRIVRAPDALAPPPLVEQ